MSSRVLSPQFTAPATVTPPPVRRLSTLLVGQGSLQLPYRTSLTTPSA